MTPPALTPAELAAMQARADAATPGPWFDAYSAVQSAPLIRAFDAAEALIPDGTPDTDPRWEALPECTVASVPRKCGDTPTAQGALDAAFIASARSDVPRLLAEVARLQGALDAAERERGALRSQMDTLVADVAKHRRLCVEVADARGARVKVST